MPLRSLLLYTRSHLGKCRTGELGEFKANLIELGSAYFSPVFHIEETGSTVIW
jgi:hypothetical protein